MLDFRAELRRNQVGVRDAGHLRGSSATGETGGDVARSSWRSWGRFRGNCGRRYVREWSAIRGGTVLGLCGVRLFTYVPVRDHVFVWHGNALLIEAGSIILYKDVPIDKTAIHIVTRYVKPRLGDNARIPVTQHPILAGAAGTDFDASTDREFVVEDKRRGRR